MKMSKLFSVSVVFSACLFVLWGCPKKADMSSVPGAPTAEQASAAQAEAAKAESLAQQEKELAAKAREEAKLAAEAEEARKKAEAEALKPIYFDFDQAFISEEARAALEANAGWLKAKPEAVIRIEGHCDERGTKEYNIVLGQRRATSARKYLTDLGIAESRISLISYGKERPSCEEQTEACRQANRRDDFIVVAAD